VVKKRKVGVLVAVICFESAKCVFSKYREYGAFFSKFAWNVFDSPRRELQDPFFKMSIRPTVTEKIAIKILRVLLHSLVARGRTAISDMFLKSPQRELFNAFLKKVLSQFGAEI
jgi:hypothetical protein